MKKIIFLGVVILFAMNTFATVQLAYEKNKKTGQKLVVLKNSLLTAVINSDRGGMLESFIPINSNHEEVYISSDNKGGMCEHIIAGSNQNREVSFSPYKMKIVEQSPVKVVVSFSYLMKSGKLKDIEFIKTYTMVADSATLEVHWTIKNHTSQHQGVSPWIRNIVTGYDQDNITIGKAPLDSDSSVMLTCGAFRKVASAADGFFEPVRNWFSRVPKNPTKGKNIVTFVFDYNEVFQFYTVHFKHMHTMELLFRFVDIAPKKSWTGKFIIASGGSLPDVRFASRDISANLIRKDNALELSVTSPRMIKDAKICLLDANDKIIGTKTTTILPLETQSIPFANANGDIFKLQVFENGKDLMIDHSYTGKYAQMTSTLASFHAPRRPEKFSKVLEPWKKEIPDFVAPTPRKWNVKLVKCKEDALQLWPVNNLERIMENDYPASANAFANVTYTASGAKGERENFQIALRNSGKNSLQDVSIELSSLDIKNLEMNWNVLEYITTERPTLGMNVVGRWPEVLSTDRKFDIASNQTRSVWVEFKIPRDVLAGNYKAVAKVKVKNNIVAEIPIKIKVYDFELPKVPNLRTDAGRFYGDYHKMAKRYGYKGTPKQLLNLLNLSILDHRMSPRGLVASRNNLKEYEEDLVRHIKLGANVFAFPSTQYSSLKTRKALEDIHQKHNVINLSYTYAFDEIHSEQIEHVKKWCANWKKNHKIPILVVYYGGPVQPLYDSIDIWCRAHYKEDAILLADRLNKDEIWHTNTNLFALESRWVTERADIWKACSLGMKGRLLWSVASWTNSPYVQVFRSGCNLHGVLYYPAPEGIRPGVRLKVIANSVDDFDYLTILKDEIKRVEKINPNNLVLKEAKELLQDKFYLKSNLTGNAFLKKRNKVGECIEKLKSIK